jgi:uncharacterized protein (TIGR02266 family)
VTPEAFAKLPKEKMFAELRRQGIVHGQGSSKAELVTYYREWHAAQAASSEPQADAVTERRSALRARIEVEIDVRTETNFFVGFSGDISEGGIFVATVSLLPMGTAVALSFSFPGGIVVEAAGEVAWTRQGVAFDSDLESGMGIRFTDVSADAFAAIQEFMRIREPIFHAD